MSTLGVLPTLGTTAAQSSANPVSAQSLDNDKESFKADLLAEILSQNLNQANPMFNSSKATDTGVTDAKINTTLSMPNQDMLAMMLAMPTKVALIQQTDTAINQDKLINQDTPINQDSLAQQLETTSEPPQKTIIHEDSSSFNINEPVKTPLLNQTEPVINTAATTPDLINAVNPQVIVKNTPTIVNSAPIVDRTATYTIPSAVGESGWSDAISQRIVWMSSENIQTATLNISPPHLGPIQVQIQMDNQQTNVQFYTTQADVKLALQNSMPLLTQLFEQTGMQLGEAKVDMQHFDFNQQSNPQQQQQSAQQQFKSNSLLKNEHVIDPSTASNTGSNTFINGNGLLNIYA